MRRRYEIEIRDERGTIIVAITTRSPTGELVRRAGVHTTDSWDWLRAADEAFARGSEEWVAEPFTRP